MQQELAGALRERVAIEAWIDARDAAGGVAGYWQPQGQAFAAIEPDIGGAGVIALGDTRRSRRRWRVTLRMPAVVTLASRLIWQSRILAVLAVEDDPRAPDRLVVRCEVREP
jgi:head-tail adaptor